MVLPSAVVQSSALGLLLHTDADEGLTKTLKGCLHPKSDLLIFLCHLCAASPHPHILTPLLASWGLCQGCPWVCWGCSSFWQQDLGVLLPFDSPGVGNSQSQSADSCLCNSGAVSSQRTAVIIRPFTWRN